MLNHSLFVREFSIPFLRYGKVCWVSCEFIHENEHAQEKQTNEWKKNNNSNNRNEWARAELAPDTRIYTVNSQTKTKRVHICIFKMIVWSWNGIITCTLHMPFIRRYPKWKTIGANGKNQQLRHLINELCIVCCIDKGSRIRIRIHIPNVVLNCCSRATHISTMDRRM